jgi:hypothetical protein
MSRADQLTKWQQTFFTMGLPMVKIKEDVQAKALVNEMVKPEAPVAIEDMPLETLADYMRYNEAARKMNKKLRLNRYPIKQCPVELHPTDRIEFGRNDQPNNALSVYLSNDMIEFKMKLYPGKTYDLPRCVVDHIASKGLPVWKWFDNPDGSKETRIASKTPRFAMRTVRT